MDRWIFAAVAATVVGSAAGVAQSQPAAPMLDGAVFRSQVILPPDSTLVASTTFSIKGTRGTLVGWALQQRTTKQKCELQGLTCAIDAHLEVQIAPDGESATQVVRRSDGKILPGSLVLPRVW